MSSKKFFFEWFVIYPHYFYDVPTKQFRFTGITFVIYQSIVIDILDTLDLRFLKISFTSKSEIVVTCLMLYLWMTQKILKFSFYDKERRTQQLRPSATRDRLSLLKENPC